MFLPSLNLLVANLDLPYPLRSIPIEKEDKGKGVVNEPSRLGSRLQCLKCNGIGHIAIRCPARTLVIQEDVVKVEDVEELVYDPNVEEIQDVEVEWEDDPSYLACIRAISPQVDDFKDIFGVPRVNVVRCALAKQRDTNDWRSSAIF